MFSQLCKIPEQHLLLFSLYDWQMCDSSLEFMYVTPDLSGVENEILGAAAQPFGAKTEILGVARELECIER